MNFALSYARESRYRMMLEMKEAFMTVCHVNNDDGQLFCDELDVHHNYATIENHFGHNVWVHRKGAISTKKGEFGIIPGSQGSSSYIVKGLGNIFAFMSSPHGAGRRFGRNDACRTLNMEDETKKMEGIVYDSYGTTTLGGQEYPDLQEAEGAYKNIDEVMANSADLCEIVTKLRPLGSIKNTTSVFKKR
jgi:tRNA-splicing ligase RtcB